ncbi:hypothetical protein B0A54_14354 [Friedmanniomyces endolithicus]|uniref:Cytokinesis regulator n=1 Tax=Friedmanniomyces endolithicus TaxID=329885 RepID=A0A4U0UC41_9PEZI|nr:hypothetical protein B0A54_14354 [Friedmanniomyces endolithicus]
MEAESWDEDFDGDIQPFGNSVGTTYTQTSISSRLSVHSESLAGDDDWNVVIQPNDEQSTSQAIQSAKQAGIPLPKNVPSSALLGGTIKRLGKQKSRPKLDDDWGMDFDSSMGGLEWKKQTAPEPHDEDFDDFGELEGSLGIRFAGTKRDARNRSSSASAMSPSLGSVTVESDGDQLGGLEIPDEPMDFAAMIQKRKAGEAELSDLSQPSPAIEQPSTLNLHKKSKLLSNDNDDFLDGFDLGGGDILNRKTRLNKNLKIKDVKPTAPALRPATTLNFHDKPVDKPMHMRSHLPRPVSGSKPPTSRLEPVSENGVSHAAPGRRLPTASGPQLLRSKRSMPAIGSQRSIPIPPKTTFIPSGLSGNQSSHASAQRAMPYHLRRDSEPNRNGAQSPPPRAHSRLSNAFVPETPSRTGRQTRKDLAPAALAREAAAKRNLTKPARKRNFGDGSELEIFDDLPTSQVKESKFVKEPIARGPPRTLRHAPSRSDLRDPVKRTIGIPDRMMTPAPPRTPASPTKGFHAAMQSNTPSYLRDTAASRIARESKLTNAARPRSQGPLMPMSTNTNTTDWKAQLITKLGVDTTSDTKGMKYNSHLQRWEGNENVLEHFEIPPPLQTPTPTGQHGQTSFMDRMPHGAPSSSPPRPALIAPMSQATQGVQVNGGMVFDPRQMKWLKLKDGQRDVSGPISPSVTDGEEEEDAFAGIDDLRDENTPAAGAGGSTAAGMASPVSMAAAGTGEVHEEFDLGPNFIRHQREEEACWRKRCEGWFSRDGEPRVDDGAWRWSIRDMVSQGF